MKELLKSLNEKTTALSSTRSSIRSETLVGTREAAIESPVSVWSGPCLALGQAI
jgi:hypothetical protein